MSFISAVRYIRWLLCCLVLVLASAGTARSQAPCTQKLADLPNTPELFGFRPGMTKDDIKTYVPQIVFGKTDEFGLTKTTINPSYDPRFDQKRFAGVRSISLDLLDNRLTSVWIGYDETFKVQTVEQFIPLITEALHLPAVWSSWKGRGQQIRCADFQAIVTTLAGGPTLRILDTAAESMIADRRQAKEERDSGVSSAQNESAEEIIGDKETNTFYSAGCKSAKDVNPGNRVVFRTMEDAERAGFKLAKDCH